jgi:hypothetical protein
VICLADDGQRPLWGGIITNRKTSLGGVVTLQLATVAEYFDRRFVGNHSWTGIGQNHIARFLVNTYAGMDALEGLPIRAVIEDTVESGTPRDRTYSDADDKSLLSVLQDLAGVSGGIEWVTEWENVNNKITPVFRVGSRIGSQAPAGLLPGVQFNSPGSVLDAEYEESYKAGDGANDVMATSSGAADARPQSAHWKSGLDNRPRVEYRWSPSSSTTQISTLDSHASRALGALKDGMKALSLQASRAKAPELGAEWRIGDDVFVDLVSEAWSGGFTGVARVVGWDLTETTVSPILLIDPATVVWTL